METVEGIKGGVKRFDLFFADDIFHFVEAGADQIECIKEVLQSFCKASGQSINFIKSLIYFSPSVTEQEASV